MARSPENLPLTPRIAENAKPGHNDARNRVYPVNSWIDSVKGRQ
jgi:hypothetical protein